MPNFWGCRCCGGTLIVVACNGQFNIINGNGRRVSTIFGGASGAAHNSGSGWIKWISSSRFIYSAFGSGFARYSKTELVSTVGPWFSVTLGKNPYLKQLFAVGEGGQHGCITGFVGFVEKGAKIFELDETTAGSPAYDNRGHPYGPSDAFVTYGNGQYRIQTYEITAITPAPASESIVYVFEPNGTLVSSFNLKDKFGLADTDFTTYLHQCSTAFGTVYSFTDGSGAKKLACLDWDDEVLWESEMTGSAAVSSVYLTIAADGNVVLTSPSNTGISIVSSETGEILGQYAGPVGMNAINVRGFVPDPKNAENAYIVTNRIVNGSLDKWSIVNEDLIWTHGLSGLAPSMIDAVSL